MRKQCVPGPFSSSPQLKGPGDEATYHPASNGLMQCVATTIVDRKKKQLVSPIRILPF